MFGGFAPNAIGVIPPNASPAVKATGYVRLLLPEEDEDEMRMLMGEPALFTSQGADVSLHVAMQNTFTATDLEWWAAFCGLNKICTRESDRPVVINEMLKHPKSLNSLCRWTVSTPLIKERYTKEDHESRASRSAPQSAPLYIEAMFRGPVQLLANILSTSAAPKVGEQLAKRKHFAPLVLRLLDLATKSVKNDGKIVFLRSLCINILSKLIWSEAVLIGIRKYADQLETCLKAELFRGDTDAVKSLLEVAAEATQTNPNIASVDTSSSLNDVKVCNVCKSVEGLKKCGRCKAVSYCGPTCQKKDWPEHKKKCIAA